VLVRDLAEDLVVRSAQQPTHAGDRGECICARDNLAFYHFEEDWRSR